MSTIIVNANLAELFIAHGIPVKKDEEFIYPDLPIAIKLKARSVYQEINGQISSQLDVLIVTPDGINIVESFGDFGVNLDEAIMRNFHNFSLSSFHTLLAAFGCDKEEILQQVEFEKWNINDKMWNVYLGSMAFKAIGNIVSSAEQTDQFYYAVENGIKSQPLTNNIHWFRGYYMQHNDKITITEFLIDNNLSPAIDTELHSIPIIPNIEFSSCRLFVFLRPASNLN